jgi:hypothetical protein
MKILLQGIEYALQFNTNIISISDEIFFILKFWGRKCEEAFIEKLQRRENER